MSFRSNLKNIGNYILQNYIPIIIVVVMSLAITEKIIQPILLILALAIFYIIGKLLKFNKNTIILSLLIISGLFLLNNLIGAFKMREGMQNSQGGEKNKSDDKTKMSNGITKEEYKKL